MRRRKIRHHDIGASQYSLLLSVRSKCGQAVVAGISAAGCINRKIESNFNVNSISPGGKEANGVS